MVKLKKFAIINYRSCLKSSIDLQEDLTCLIGVNGVGKTNILNGIQLLKKIRGGSKIANQKQKNVGSQTTISATFLFNDKSIEMKGVILYETDDRNYDEVLGANLKFNLSEFTGSNKWIEISSEVLQYMDQIKGGGRKTFLKYFFDDAFFEIEDQLITPIRNFLRRISYYSASQFSDPTKCPISFELEESKPFRQSRYNIYHEKFLNDLYLTYKRDKKLFSKFLTTVNKEGIGIIDNWSFSEYDMPSSSYNVKSGGKIEKIEKNRQLIIPYVTVDSIELSPNQLSEGTFKTLALIFYIITDDNDLLLIEEPEVCVHHGLLNSIMSLILTYSTRKQIIISTHSDFVLDKLKPHNILIVKKHPKSGTNAKSISKLLSKSDYKALKDYLSEVGNLGEYWKEGGLENE
ncbi:AAA family ATPase [Niabella sp. CJ426]|uniref:AAA family ATPase n=1 Tax=Niabella sp. CJ426 TaxID=3393740 RepID=UPI003D00BB00